MNSENTIEAEKVDIPLQLIYSTKDKMLPQEIKSRFKNIETADLKAFGDKKHLFLKTLSTEIANAIDKFIQKQSLR